MVDQISSTTGTAALSAGIQIDGSTATLVADSPALQPIAEFLTSFDDHYYKFIWGSDPVNEIELMDVDLGPVLVAGTTDVSGTVRNNGFATITSFILDWNDGTSHSETITETIPAGETYYFTHPTPITLTAGVTLNLDVCATVIDDENVFNDCKSSTHTIASQLGTRLPPLELFTSSTCAPCYYMNYVTFGGSGLNAYLSEANANEETGAEVAIIKYQESYPGVGDHAYNNDVDVRQNYYYISGIPDLLIAPYEIYTPEEVAVEAARPAFLDITATHTWDGDEITVDVTIDPYLDWSGNTVHIALLDKEYEAGDDESFTNSEPEFHHILRKLLPDPLGQTIELTSGVPYTISESYTTTTVASGFPEQGSYDLHLGSEREVVVFIQDSVTKKILNAAIATFAGYSTIDENSSTSNISIFPNPSSGNVNLAIDLAAPEKVNYYLTDLAGKIVLNGTENELPEGKNQILIEGSKLNNGVYFVNVQIGAERVTKRIVIQK